VSDVQPHTVEPSLTRPRYFTDSWVKEIVTFDYDIVSELA
jgi:hypothetical protein